MILRVVGVEGLQELGGLGRLRICQVVVLRRVLRDCTPATVSMLGESCSARQMKREGALLKRHGRSAQAVVPVELPLNVALGEKAPNQVAIRCGPTSSL